MPLTRDEAILASKTAREYPKGFGAQFLSIDRSWLSEIEAATGDSTVTIMIDALDEEPDALPAYNSADTEKLLDLRPDLVAEG